MLGHLGLPRTQVFWANGRASHSRRLAAPREAAGWAQDRHTISFREYVGEKLLTYSSVKPLRCRAFGQNVEEDLVGLSAYDGSGSRPIATIGWPIEE